MNILTLILINLISIANAQTHHIGCTTVKFSQVCEKQDQYSFRKGSETWFISKVDFKKNLKNLISKELKSTNWPFESIFHSEVRVWLFADGFVGSNLYAEISSVHKNFLINLPLDNQKMFSPQSSPLLLKTSYPVNKGSILGKIIGNPKKGQTNAALDLLKMHGSKKIKIHTYSSELDVLEVTTPFWQSEEIINSLKRSPDYNKIFNSVIQSPNFSNIGFTDLAFRVALVLEIQ